MTEQFQNMIFPGLPQVAVDANGYLRAANVLAGNVRPVADGHTRIHPGGE